MNRETLSHCVRVCVPSKFGPQQTEDLALQKRLLWQIVGWLGDGATIYKALGLWQGITEVIEVVEVFCADVDHAIVEHIASYLLGNGQQSVAIVIDGQLHLYSE